MLRVALVDDEPLARRRLHRLLGAHPGVAVVGEAGSLAEAALLVARERPDGLFLDIGLPDAEGFELLSAAVPAPRIVFVTAHARHAVRAFEVGALDYLLKPVKPERLAAAVARLAEACAAPPPPDAPPAMIQLRTPGRSLVTPVGALVALQAEGDFTRVLLEADAPLLICRTLGSFVRQLPMPPFVRLDRSLIINAAQLRAVEARSRSASRIRLAGIAEALELGRAATQRLKALQTRLAR